MVDCLTVLRDWNIKKLQPKEMLTPDQQTLLVFGDYAWPKTTQTNFKMFAPAGQKTVDYYSLDAIRNFAKKLS